MVKSMSEHAGETLARGIGRGRAKVTDGTSILSFVSTQHNLASARKREISVSRRELADQIRVLKQELKRMQGAQPRERYAAIVGLEVLSRGEFTLELEYTTRGGARWQPLYDLRLLEEEDNPIVELMYLGQVQQSTGEDWLDVDLVLSTARPAVSAQLPELDPWYINLYQPPVLRHARARQAAAPMPAALAEPTAGAFMGI
jgi:uncharacterized protein (TIGR02231 family)